jgi:hypothetical protein
MFLFTLSSVYYSTFPKIFHIESDERSSYLLLSQLAPQIVTSPMHAKHQVIARAQRKSTDQPKMAVLASIERSTKFR